MININEVRVEQTVINKNHILFNTINDFCIRSTNMYNFANFYVRKNFLENKKWIRYQEMQKLFKSEEPYKKLMSQSSQCILQVLERDWKSFFEGAKAYRKDSTNFIGTPKFPRYKKKGCPSTWYLKNNNTYIKDGKLFFRLKVMNGFGFKTSVKDRLISVRFVPKNGIIILEIIYEKQINIIENKNNNILGVDFGVDNFITMSNNVGKNPILIKGKIIKSINQYYNKSLSFYKSKLETGIYTSNRIKSITRKRNFKIKNYMHHVSKFILEYCIVNNISKIVIGYNKTWKQGVKFIKKVKQNFICIPYELFLLQLKYKAKDYGVEIFIIEESYTSGTSFLDNEIPIKENYNKSRRIERGLFKSNSGKLINSDVNASLQIIKKVFPNAFENGIEVCLTPISINNIYRHNYKL